MFNFFKKNKPVATVLPAQVEAAASVQTLERVYLDTQDLHALARAAFRKGEAAAVNRENARAMIQEWVAPVLKDNATFTFFRRGQGTIQATGFSGFGDIDAFELEEMTAKIQEVFSTLNHGYVMFWRDLSTPAMRQFGAELGASMFMNPDGSYEICVFDFNSAKLDLSEVEGPVKGAFREVWATFNDLTSDMFSTVESRSLYQFLITTPGTA